MRLDVDNAGFDYDFDEGLKAQKGMSITIDLYKELSLSDSYTLEDNFKKLVRHSVVPVFYNGKQISENPVGMKWGQETEDAWFNLKREGALRIYSQGLLVTETYQHGVGGVLVTKPGHPFELNMARNDIIKDKCEVWARVKKVLSAKARELGDKGANQNTLTDSQRREMAMTALTEGSLDNLWERPLFTLTNGKHMSLRNLTNREIWAEAPAGDRKADVLIQRKALFALSPETLDRFGVDTLAELKERLIAKCKRHMAVGDHDRWSAERYLERLAPVNVHPNLKAFEKLVNLDFELVKSTALTPNEKSVLVALRKMSYTLSVIMTELRRDSLGEESDGVPKREVHIINSATANGMTDGRQNIWINRKQLAKAHLGVPGFFELTTLMAHEYAHLTSSQGSHHHDHAFYETYHDLTRDSTVTRMAINAFGVYLKHADKSNATVKNHMDMVFKGDLSVLFQANGEEALAAQEAEHLTAMAQRTAAAAPKATVPVTEAPVTPAATPRRRRRAA